MWWQGLGRVGGQHQIFATYKASRVFNSGLMLKKIFSVFNSQFGLCTTVMYLTYCVRNVLHCQYWSNEQECELQLHECCQLSLFYYLLTLHFILPSFFCDIQHLPPILFRSKVLSTAQNIYRNSSGQGYKHQQSYDVFPKQVPMILSLGLGRRLGQSLGRRRRQQRLGVIINKGTWNCKKKLKDHVEQNLCKGGILGSLCQVGQVRLVRLGQLSYC